MNAPIIKIPASGVHVEDLVQRLNRIGVAKGGKFVLKFKVKKRYKLRAFRLQEFFASHCECCGRYIQGSFRNSHRTLSFDTHFGSSYIFPRDICR